MSADEKPTDGGWIANVLPYAPRDTRQVEGRKTEGRILKALGAVLHPNSGAGNIKDDGHDDHRLYEIKDARKTHTLKADDLRALFVRAVRQGKQAVYLVYFSDQDFTVECRLVPGGKELVR